MSRRGSNTCAPRVAVDGSRELDRILRARLVRSAYQPIVEIDTGRLAGYEALARGPAGSQLERPDRLFEAARTHGRLVELEWVCRRAALEGALELGITFPLTLFINVEPETLGEPVPALFEALFARAQAKMRLAVEITERAVTARPAQAVATTKWLRARGCAVALDDVGADPRSLALMPLLAPDVIKLDLSLVRENPSPRIATIAHAVNAHAERTGAAVLVEGIETVKHRDTGLTLGARLAQGYFYGRPSFDPRLEATVASAHNAIASLQVPHKDIGDATPYELVSKHVTPRRGNKRLLLAISRQLEQHAADHGDTAMLLATFQTSRHFTPRTARRYSQMADRAALVGALGAGMTSTPAPGVRGASLNANETLAGEWDVVALAPHFAAAFVARDLGDTGVPDEERRFDFCLTHDRALATAAAHALIARVQAEDPTGA